MTQTLPDVPPPAVLAALADLPDVGVLAPRGAARVRTAVTVPLRFPDGWRTTARVVTFDGLTDGQEHLALALGDWEAALARSAAGGDAPLVRPHSECLTGDVFGSERCDCGPQLREAVERIATTGGFLLYLRQEGRGIGLYAKLDALRAAGRRARHLRGERGARPRRGRARLPAAAQMLRALGADRIALLSNNPDKAAQLERLGIEVSERIPTAVHLSPANARYLSAKVVHTAHTLDLPVAG